jgi:hypothetical protein
MAYPHFLLLCKHLEELERQRARLTASAFHSPAALWEKPEHEQDFSANRRKIAALLGVLKG